MGSINEAFSQNKITFSKVEKILENLINQEKNNSQNKNVLQEIGLLKEYSYLTNHTSNELIYFSQKSKTIKNYLKLSKKKSNFVQWIQLLFDIRNEDSDENLHKKIDILKKKPLNKKFFQKNIKKNLLQDKSFNKLINFGIPSYLRDFVWDVIIEEKYGNHTYFNFEQELEEYNFLLKNVKNSPQIEKDLNRTFIKDSDKTTKNIHKLRNILNCINKYTKSGYCQGMNFIVGFLLKVTNFNEIRAFYIFKNIYSDIKGYYDNGFTLLNKNISIFDNYFHELNPKLYNHFKRTEIYNELWVSKWFQTLFTLSLSYEELCPIWDILLFKGFNHIIYIALSIIESMEKPLLELNDSSDIYEYMNNALNSADVVCKYNNLLENVDEIIIPLNVILSKAYDIEKKIKEEHKSINYSINSEHKNNNNIVTISSTKTNTNTKINKVDKKTEKINRPFNDIDSIDTKESENSNKKSNSSLSSKNCCINTLKSSNLANIQSNINKLKNNMYNAGFELNNNDIIKKKSTFFSTKNLGRFNFNENNDSLIRRASIPLGDKSVNFNGQYTYNYSYSNNILPQNQYFLINNNYNYNLINNNPPQYSNFLIVYT